MKKILCLLIVFVLAACVVPVSAAEACPACGETVTWEPMPAAAPTAAGHYHYALAADQTNAQWILKDGVTLCVDLKGHTLRPSDGRVFNLNTGSGLNILDSVGTGKIIAKTGSNNVTGGLMTIAKGAACSQYGGELSLETKYVSGRGVGTGGIVYMNADCTYNLYGGTILGADLVKSEYTLTYNGYGAAFYMANAAKLNVYGGEIKSGTVPEGGKGECVYVRTTTPKVTLSGSGRIENIYFVNDSDQLVADGCFTGSVGLTYPSSINIIQGSVLGSCRGANIARADIRCGDWMLVGEDGKLIAVPNSEAAVCGETTRYFPTVAEAVAGCDSGYVKLLKNGLTFEANKAITLDLNGQNATVNGGSLTVFDSQTDDHAVSDGIYGTLTGTAVAAENYIPVEEEGKLSFHRADLEIYAMTLRPGVAGVYYQSRILCDEKAAGQVDTYGVALNVYEAPSAENMDTTTRASVFAGLTSGETLASGTLLHGIMKTRNTDSRNEANSRLPVYGSAYLKTVDGQYIFSDPVSRSLQQQVEAADALWRQLEDSQKTALLAFYNTYEPICSAWDVPNMKEGKLDYTFNAVDGQYFVDAVKALSDSTYSGMDLASRLYVHAYTQDVMNNNGITDTALEDLLTGENTALSDMVAAGLFGGKDMPATLPGVKGTAGAVTEKDLRNGDILLADSKVYAYADGLWLLEKGAKKQDTQAVLGALPEAGKYAVLRPSVVLAELLTPTDVDAPLDRLNEYQEALIATAEAYLLRGEKLQYADTRFTAQGTTLNTEFRWQSTVNAPEDCTSAQWGYTNCAAFTYEVYYQALGFKLPDDMYTTKKLTNNSPGNGTRVYYYHREVDSVQTEEEKAQVQQEFLSNLQPGDILVVLRNNSSGHAMLYVGNGNIIHSGGSVYQYTASVGTEVYEASIRRMKVQDYLFNPASAKGYVFGVVTDLSIIRPLDIFEGEIPENTQNRVANLRGVMAQKLCSHTKAQTVNPGDTMTFTYEIYNTNSAAVTLDIAETLPRELSYVSGTAAVSGSSLSWQVTVPADTRVQVSYTARVNPATPYGASIQSMDSTVGGVTVKCAPVQVRRTFTAAEQAAMIAKVEQLRAEGNSLTGLALANEIYKAATGETVFDSTDITTVAEGTEGIFSKWKMSTESTSRQLFQVNTGSKYQKLVAPTLYGGYRLYTPQWQHDRTRLPQPDDLQVGDLLIGRTLSSRVYCLYLGEELGFVNLGKATLDADTVTAEKRLERLHGYGYYFAILRPSFGLETE